MTANTRSIEIATSITDNLNGDLPQDEAELKALLETAARFGKIAGLRKARKLARKGEFYKVGASIRNTYVTLGFDTDAYEQTQADVRQAKIDARNAALDASPFDTFFGTVPEFPTVAVTQA